MKSPITLAMPALFLALPATAQDVTLTLYTSQPNADAQQTVDAFLAGNPDIAVEFVRDGTTQIMARLLTEIEAGQAQPDVLLIADNVTMESMEAEGHLLAYPEADVSAYPEGLHDDERHYFSTKLITTGLIRNTSAPMELTSWMDLTSEMARGQVAMPSPLTSGAALINYATLRGVDGLGRDYFEALAANDALAQGGNGGVFRAVAGGEKMYGIVVDFLPIREAAAGSPVEFVFPEEGVSAVTEPVAIMASTDAPDAAKRFVDFLLSMEGQELAASQGYLPAHPDVTPPPGFPPQSEITVLGYDAAEVLRMQEDLKVEFADTFGQ
ncbi:ABC transporter substrate-binding protein [Jannaschia sp. LMIT008]|uniref:ABC transporter substrate-binding protein n=1 Tax=Jannaschia maritima TaxID=3032585 RepID=UPI00281171A8|nr:ABC transporter substrate-binding protein [Jannaschia sp. LMIT008]